jgi:hypothetical protein
MLAEPGATGEIRLVNRPFRLAPERLFDWVRCAPAKLPRQSRRSRKGRSWKGRLSTGLRFR